MQRSSPSSLHPGLFSYELGQGEARTHVHLRVDGDGSAVLLVNAAQVFQLNPSAALMAYLYLEGLPEAKALARLRSAFRVPKAQALGDLHAFNEQMQALLGDPQACPIHDLALDVIPPFSAMPSAPYRMDLALTYRCNNDCAHCYNARSRDFPELSTVEWKQAIDSLWAVGIPHVVFTGGEPTVRRDLPELVAYAQAKGMVTGLNTNGRRLRDAGYVDALVSAGLDHVQITLESHDPVVHDAMVRHPGAWRETVAGLENALRSRLYVMTNSTLLRNNTPVLGETLDFLARQGVPTVGLNALIYSGHALSVDSGLSEEELPPLLDLARERCSAHGQRLIWYTPTQYCHFDPVQMELGVKGCTAARYNMAVEPNGDVLPCQSYYTPLGNLLLDPWRSIWNAPLALSLREHRDLPTGCAGCAFLGECGGGCPLYRQANGQAAQGPRQDSMEECDEQTTARLA